METGLQNRSHGQPPAHFIYDKEMPEDLLDIISSKLQLKEERIRCGGRYHLMRDLMKFPKVRPDLGKQKLGSAKPSAHKPFSSILENHCS